MGKRKSYTSLLVVLTILFTQIIPGSLVFATGKITTQPEHQKPLFETKDTLIVNDTIELPANTIFYGEINSENPSLVTIQFGLKEITVEGNKLIEIPMTEVVPEYEEYKNDGSLEWIEKKKGGFLFPSVESDLSEVKILTDLKYPILETDSELKYILIGNTKFLLDKESQEKYFAESKSDEKKPDQEKTQNENTEPDAENDDKTIETEPEKKDEKATVTDPVVEKSETETSNENDDVVSPNDSKTEAESSDDNKTDLPKIETKDVDVWEYSDAKFFKVVGDVLPIYDNRSGSLIKIGELTKGQVYPRISSYGKDWHKVQFGSIFGYVYSSETVPATGEVIENKNTTYEQSNRSFITVNEAVVFDNSGSTLQPFGTIDSNKTYPIVSDYGNWYRILFMDRVGYVRKGDVSTNFVQSDDYFQVLNNNVPVYDNRSGALKEVGELVKGQSYKRISSYGPNWHKIKFGNIYGYIYSRDTKPSNGRNIKNKNQSLTNSAITITAMGPTGVYGNSSNKLVKFATLKEGTSYPVVSDYGNWWRVIISGRVGYIQKNDVISSVMSDDQYFKVVNGDAPIYINRNGKLIIVGELLDGEVYPRISSYGPNWHKIKYGNNVAYIHDNNTAKAIKTNLKSENQSYENSNTIMAITNDIGVYDNLGRGLVEFGVLESGTKYPIVSDYGNWWRVLLAGRVGYIHKNGVRELFEEGKQPFKMRQNAPLFLNKEGKLIQVATLYQGQVFERIQDYGNWHKLKYENTVGFVWKDATEPANYSFTSADSTGELITLKDTILYDDINSSNRVMLLENSQRIPLIRKFNESWYVTSIAGRSMYVKSTDVIQSGTSTIGMENNKNARVIRDYLIDSPLVGDDWRSKDVNETIEAANLILHDKIEFPNYGTMDYTDGIDWKHGVGVSDPNQNSFLRQLHGLFFINDISVAYRETKDERYIQKGYEIIMDWNKENPKYKPSHYMAWHDEGTARRLSSLVNFFDAGRGVLSSEQKETLFTMMTYHADLLASDSFYSENTNHGMFQDEALIVFSKYFYHYDEFGEYYNLAVQRMSGYFQSLISDDYVHLEHSPSYHQVIAGALRSYGTAIQLFGDEEKARIFLDVYENMAYYATHVIKPDGLWPLIADTYDVNNPPASILWEDNPYYQYAASNGAIGKMPTETNAVFKDAGYAIFRDGWTSGTDETYMFFSAAYHTSYHKHSDDLSLWIYNGEDVITEAGPYSYALSDPTTQYAYSSFGHNTLIVNDQGLPRVDGLFNKTYLESSNLDDVNKPKATGVNRRFEGVEHKRQVVYDKTAQVIHVNDSIASSEKNNYKLLWHLAPNIKPVINNETNHIQLVKNGEVIMTMDIDGAVDPTIRSVYGKDHPLYKGLQFRYNEDTNELEEVSTHLIILEYNGESASITTSFNLLK